MCKNVSSAWLFACFFSHMFSPAQHVPVKAIEYIGMLCVLSLLFESNISLSEA